MCVLQTIESIIIHWTSRYILVILFQDKATPLFISAQNGHYKILVYLLSQGAEADSRRTDGATPLWIAAQMGQDHIVSQLLKSGARVDASRHVSKNILFWLKYKVKAFILLLGWRYRSFQSVSQRTLRCGRRTVKV